MRVGFTGTRYGMTQLQRAMVMDLMSHYVRETRVEGHPLIVHHGGCVGADDQFHQLCRWLSVDIVLHPPENDKLLVAQHLIDLPNHMIMPAKGYLHRNRNIVGNSDVLLAAPSGITSKDQKGGTWYTIEYAREKNVPVRLLPP